MSKFQENIKKLAKLSKLVGAESMAIKISRAIDADVWDKANIKGIVNEYIQEIQND